MLHSPLKHISSLKHTQEKANKCEVCNTCEQSEETPKDAHRQEALKVSSDLNFEEKRDEHGREAKVLPHL
jgi:hypothetical protein